MLLIRVIADLHLHSRFSRATSEKMNLTEIARFAKIKGLQLVGTGDFTHPQWLKEIRETLVPEADSGVFRLANAENTSVYFMLTTEVCTIFDYENRNRKIHHVILTPSIEAAEQINEALGRYGSLSADGRPILNMTAPQLVEEVMSVSDDNMVFPAHAWTPWFSLFGAFSGFDRIEDCYKDQTRHIHALETGLSSDPPMNWRLSSLDRFTLLSNSDSHSFWPWRIGREANVFELQQVTYKEITGTIKTKDASRLKFTIETEPAYGKYHWTGHRNCNVSLSPSEAQKHNNICPVCGRKLTKGVDQRIEELADRPADYKDDASPGFVRLMPLSEIIAAVVGSASPSTQAVWKIYNPLIKSFGDEYAVLIDASREALAAVTEKRVADIIVDVREGKVAVTPGYDGVYGKLALPEAEKPLEGQGVEKLRLKPPRGRVQQTGLSDFW
ncbi:MAG: endonuclease Q family protein [Candidatus Bathyarchaeota archaeon]|nr:endonuclease Q family protein [Candidatus Bathyarchaeota archaeon]